MSSKYEHRVRSLTADTWKGLFFTLSGIVDMVKMFDYVLIWEFQSDRIEGEYRIYRQEVTWAIIIYHMSKLFDILNNAIFD